jgi:hypothetical protein
MTSHHYLFARDSKINAIATADSSINVSLQQHYRLESSFVSFLFKQPKIAASARNSEDSS